MGTGDVPPDAPFKSAHASWVSGDFKPAPAPQFVAWPNRGFAPFPLMPERWSLSYPGADFAAATVTMTQGGNNVPVTVISNSFAAVGDNTIVWVPSGLPTSIAADTTYNVAVTGITGAGVPASYSYPVTFFDPNVLGDSVTIAGTNTPPTSGATYTFNSIAQADNYELRVSTATSAAWTEGAEDAPTPQIQAAITGAYPLRQTARKQTGAKGFQLAFPDLFDQSFEITRDVIPSASSQLQFYEQARGTTETCTFDAEVSTNGGANWSSVYQRPGPGLSSPGWDPSFNLRTAGLAAYAGQLVRIRFVLRFNGGSAALGTTDNHGFFLDDITVTSATELENTTVTQLAGNATTFALNATTAGAALVGRHRVPPADATQGGDALVPRWSVQDRHPIGAQRLRRHRRRHHAYLHRECLGPTARLLCLSNHHSAMNSFSRRQLDDLRASAAWVAPWYSVRQIREVTAPSPAI